MKRYFLIAGSVLLLDQFVKSVIQQKMQEGLSIPVLPGIFHITYILNPGAAFGLFEEQQWLFILVAVLLVLGVAVLFRQLLQQPPVMRFGAALLVGGALGNLMDRIRLGKVVDFLDFRIWPIFNVADIAICVGVGLILLAMFKEQGDMNGGDK